MKKIIVFIALACSLFVSAPVLHAQGEYSAINWAEIATAVLRGPLARLSYQYHDEFSRKAVGFHYVTNCLRMCNELLALLNHLNDLNHVRSLQEIPSSVISSLFWFSLDFSNTVCIQLPALHKISKNLQQIKNHNVEIKVNNNSMSEHEAACQELDKEKLNSTKNSLNSVENTIESSPEQTEKVTRLVPILQSSILPFVESTTALYRAMNIGYTEKEILYRRKVQAISSLSRALSIYLNHQKSKAALLLLLGAVAETLYALQLPAPKEQNYYDYNIPEHLRGRIPAQGVFVINEGTNEAPLYCVYRDGRRYRQANFRNRDPINDVDWQPGQRVRVFACSDIFRTDDVPFFPEQFVDRCPCCDQVRGFQYEANVVIPGIPVANMADVQPETEEASRQRVNEGLQNLEAEIRRQRELFEEFCRRTGFNPNFNPFNPFSNLGSVNTADDYNQAREMLGVDDQATREEIERAHRTLIRRWHPDHNADNTEEATRIAQQINAARDLLLHVNRSTGTD